jgi:hypothetical protein
MPDDVSKSIREAKTVEEVFEILGLSYTSPEAYAVEQVWLALRSTCEEGNVDG